MTFRLVRQLLYGFFYLLIMAAIFLIVYFLFLKPTPTCFDNKKNQKETGIDCGGPCPPCELAQLKPLKVNWVRALPVRENEVSLLAEIANPNLEFGALFSYQFKIFGPFGTLSQTLSGQSFIYPSEVKYLIEAALKINPQNILRVELSIEENPVWQKELVKPRLSSRSLKTKTTNQTVKVEGLVVNEEPLLIPKLKIIALLFDRQNRILNASFTSIDDLKGLGEKFFSIELPKGKWIEQLDLNRTKIFTEAKL